MALPKFKYLAPKTISEVCSLLSEHRENAKVISGGTDLLVQMKERTLKPQYLVGLKGVSGLDRISFGEAEGLRIGGLSSIQSIVDSPVIREKFGFLADAAASIGTPQIRNMGTVGGNLCNAAPSADCAPPLIALNATVTLESAKGTRTVSLEKFFSGPGNTVCRPDELLIEIQVPIPQPRSGGAYLKLFPRGSVDIAAVGVAAMLTMAENGICRESKIVLGAVAPTPIRAKNAENVLMEREIGDNSIEEAAQKASEEAHPISDIRSSSFYRTEMVKVLTKRAVRLALEKSKSN